MKFPPDELVAMLEAVSFAAGLNVYATVATLGLLAHAGWLALPPALTLLSSWWVIGASVALFAVEFFAQNSLTGESLALRDGCGAQSSFEKCFNSGKHFRRGL